MHTYNDHHHIYSIRLVAAMRQLNEHYQHKYNHHHHEQDFDRRSLPLQPKRHHHHYIEFGIPDYIANNTCRPSTILSFWYYIYLQNKVYPLCVCVCKGRKIFGVHNHI